MNTSSIPFFTLEGHEDPVNAITFTSKNLLISGDGGGKVALWDLKIMRPLSVVKAHTAPVVAVQQYRDTFLLTQGRDGKALIWDFNQPERPVVALSVATESTGFGIGSILERNREESCSSYLSTDVLAFHSNPRVSQPQIPIPEPKAAPVSLLTLELQKESLTHSREENMEFISPIAVDETNDLLATPCGNQGGIIVHSIVSASNSFSAPAYTIIGEDADLQKRGQVFAIQWLHKIAPVPLLAAVYESGDLLVWDIRNTNRAVSSVSLFSRAHPALCLSYGQKYHHFAVGSDESLVYAHISERGEWRKRRIDGKGQSAVVFVPTTERMCWAACWDGVLRGYAVTKHGFVLASELRGKANAIAFGNGDSFWRRKNGVMAVAWKDNTISLWDMDMNWNSSLPKISKNN